MIFSNWPYRMEIMFYQRMSSQEHRNSSRALPDLTYTSILIPLNFSFLLSFFLLEQESCSLDCFFDDSAWCKRAQCSFLTGCNDADKLEFRFYFHAFRVFISNRGEYQNPKASLVPGFVFVPIFTLLFLIKILAT